MWPIVLFDLTLGPSSATSVAVEAPPPAPSAAPAQAPWVRELTQRVDVYGRFDGNLAFSRDGVDVENNGSRFGIDAQQKLPGGFTVVGHGEWSIALGQSDKHYNLSENPDTGLGTFSTSTGQPIGTRLGFVGVRSADYGALTLGKQWGVYYDVSGWTDRYTVFGANGSSTFNAGTDGGQTGEGRANDAVIYRVPIGPLRVGLQAQFLDSRSPEVDGLGASLVAELGSGFRVGAAYSHSFLDFETPIAGYDGGDAQAFTAGVNFQEGGWMLSSVNTWTHDHELVATPSATVMFDTLGAELIVSRRFQNMLMPYVGFDFAIPRKLDARYVDPNYGTKDILGGLRYLFDDTASSYAYVEGRTGGTRDSMGQRTADVVTVGIRIDYSLRRALGFEP